MHSTTSSFLAGAACSAAAMLLYQHCTTRLSKPAQPMKSTENEAELEVCFDSVDLDQRMIRKAEGAIRKRTSRLIIVVERCTNDTTTVPFYGQLKRWVYNISGLSRHKASILP